MQAELAQAGLTREYRIKRLKDCIDSREGVIKGLDMSFKLANEYPQENNQTNIQVNVMPILGGVSVKKSDSAGEEAPN